MVQLQLPLFARLQLVLQPLNLFDAHIVDKEADTIELKIVPAWLDDTTLEKGQVIFLELPDYGREKRAGEYNGYSNWTEAMQHISSTIDYHIREFEQEGENEEYLDKIYVAFCTGFQASTEYPIPTIDDIVIEANWRWRSTNFSLRLRDTAFFDYHRTTAIKSTRKYTFKFLSDDLPNVRSLFYIKGKKYICEKITATFTEEGLSQLMKFEGYQVED